MPTPLDDIRAIVEDTGPFVTVYLNAEGAVENAADLALKRWSAMRAELSAAGAPDAALDAIEELVPEAHQRGEGFAVIADATKVRLAEHYDEPLDDDRASWARVPDVAPLIKARQGRVPHVLVLADRGGADIIAVNMRGRVIETTAGDGDPERKVAPGGWSQQRYQNRAEDDWLHEAKEVAAEVARVFDEVNARLVILGGDVRAVQLIGDAMRADITACTHHINPGRAADGSEETRDRAVRRLVATAAAEQTVTFLEKFKEERGQHDLAVEGAADTIESLEKAAVEVLLVADDDATATVGDDPFPISLDFAEITDDPLNHVRRNDALIRAALTTGGSVWVVPSAGPIRDGVGGLLRWRDNS